MEEERKRLLYILYCRSRIWERREQRGSTRIRTTLQRCDPKRTTDRVNVPF